jgi:hypothetical protein
VCVKIVFSQLEGDHPEKKTTRQDLSLEVKLMILTPSSWPDKTL